MGPDVLETLTVDHNREEGWVGSPLVESGGLTHADEAGRVRMVDVSDKPVTTRRATAAGRVRLSEAAAIALRQGSLPKGDGLAVARVAAIMGVKQTPGLIPLCHPISVDAVNADLEVGPAWVDIEVTVTSQGRTGAEMEALTGVSAAALTIIDMVKAVDRQARIEEVRVVAKSGGRRGDWAPADPAPHRVPDDRAVQPRPEPHQTSHQTSHQPVGVVIVSDRCSAGLADDQTGPILVEVFTVPGSPPPALAVVPDEVAAIRDAVLGQVAAGCRLIVTSGGTGVGPRDVTPEALEPLLGRRLPGIGEALRAAGQTRTAAALLSRQVAGVIAADPAAGIDAAAAVVALPGSPTAVRDSLPLLDAVRAHLIDMVDGHDHRRTAAGPGWRADEEVTP